MLCHQRSAHRPGCHSSLALAAACISRVRISTAKRNIKLTAAALKAPGKVARAGTAVNVACRASTGAAISPPPPSSKLKRSIWTAVDVVALLGSVGGALAALLGVVSPTYALTLPLVLPVVSLIAALQREDLTNEEGRQYLSELSSSLGRDSTALLTEAAAAIEEVRREGRGQAANAARLAALEDKLAVLEGAVVGAARNSREAAVGVNALGSALQQTLQQGPAGLGQGGPIAPQAAQMLAGIIASEVVPLVKAELAGALGPWLAESNAALKRLDTRLAVVEGSLAGLEQAQSDGLMRLSNTLNSSLTDAQATLQSSVRVEVATAVEPLKQLPQLVTAAAAKAAAQQQQQQPVFASVDEQQLAAAGGAGVDRALLISELRDLVSAEVSAATQQLMSQQGDIIATMGQPPRPTPLAEDQWEALGRRLARLERLVQSIPELGEQAVAGQLAPLVAAQQAAAEAHETVVTTVANGLAGVSNQMTQGLTQIESVIQASAAGGAGDDRLQLLVGQLGQTGQQLDQLVQQAAGLASADSSLGSLNQIVQQLMQTLQQQEQQQQQQGQGPAVSVTADMAQVTDLLLSLQQQVQGLGGALQQVHMDIPMQVGLAVSQAGSPTAAAAAVIDSYDGSGYVSSDSAAVAAAANAANAAAQGISEVRQMLGEVQQACGDLQMQVGSLAAQVAEQQAVLNKSSNSGEAETAADRTVAAVEAAQQQLAAAAADVSRELSQQLRDSCSSLELQLQELQQQLTSAAAAAVASQAVADAAVAVPSQPPQPVTQQVPGSGAGGSTYVAYDGQEQQQQSGGVIGVASDPQQPYQEQPQQKPFYGQATADGWSPYQQQQQQPAPPAVEPIAGFPPAAGGWPASTASGSGVWQDTASPAGQQQLNQIAAGMALPAVRPPSPGAQQQQQQQPAIQTIPDPTSLTDEQLRTEGLRLLRAGREATRGTGGYTSSGPDFAAAETQLQAAVACFSRAVESSPQDTRALGNLGNALLAQGELKKGLLDELRLNAVQGGLGAAAAQSLEVAETRLRSEASVLLTRAGEIFRRVLEVDGWSSRALVNWGKAMVGRAELAVEQSAAIKLYNAAIDKYEAVLEEDPGLVVAKYRCALAMQGLAGLNPSAKAGGADGQGPRQQLVLLSDAASYLSDIVSSGAGGDDGLRDAAAAALRQVQQQVEMLKLGRK